MIEVVLMVLAGGVNKEIANLINVNGGNAVGLCGIDNLLLRAKKFATNGQDLGLVGEIVSVNAQFLQLLLQNGMMPVIASAVARALNAEKLVYLSDVEGIVNDGNRVSTLTRRSAEEMIAAGAINGGMIPKVRTAFETLESGVQKVHIVDGRVKHSLLLEIFTDEGIGTQIVHEEDPAVQEAHR